MRPNPSTPTILSLGSGRGEILPPKKVAGFWTSHALFWVGTGAAAPEGILGWQRGRI